EVITDPPVDFSPISGDEDDEEPRKYYVGDVPVKVMSERVQYMDKGGKLITESLIDYTKKNIIDRYDKLDDFLQSWTQAERKRAILDELEDNGVFLEAVRAETGRDDLDDFDLICHLAYDKPPLTKQERVENVKKRHYLYKYSEEAQEVISALLEKYADDGIKEIEDTRVLQLQDFAEIGSTLKIVKEFGGKAGYLEAVQELTNELYA